jgi:hypothetical protein
MNNTENSEGIKVGDEVYLRGHGKFMMIVRSVAMYCEVDWLDDAGKPQRQIYPVQSLTKKRPELK